MPPRKPLLTTTNHFSAKHPIKLMTLRPNTWRALETLIELVVVFYLVWALFYLFYLCVCGAAWSVRGVRNCVDPRTRKERDMKDESEERSSDDKGKHRADDGAGEKDTQTGKREETGKALERRLTV